MTEHPCDFRQRILRHWQRATDARFRAAYEQLLLFCDDYLYHGAGRNP